MNYQQAIREINSLSINVIKPGLERITKACQILDNPEKKFKSIHIAGTNGKGSVCAFVSQILIESKLKVGLTISPHLYDLRERFQINNEWISENDFCEIHQYLKLKLNGFEDLSYFEWTILIAFEYFKRQQVDYAVLETGMGGRWDATNSVQPEIGVITNVSLDHTQFLGNDELSILKEKIQILKPGMKAVSGVYQKECVDYLKKYCEEKNIPLYLIDKKSDSKISLLGEHQKINAQIASQVCSLLNISQKNINQGLQNTKWPGRLEIISHQPEILVDCAHNEEGISALVDFLKTQNKKYHLVFTTLKDRPFLKMLKPLLEFSKKITFVLLNGERNFTESELIEKINLLKPSLQIPFEIFKMDQKFQLKNGPYLVCGSIYLVGWFIQKKSSISII